MGYERRDDSLSTVDDEGMNRLVKFTCKQCGHCCLNLSGAIEVCATAEDIQRWQENNRTDILAWVDVIYLGEEGRVYDSIQKPAMM